MDSMSTSARVSSKTFIAISVNVQEEWRQEGMAGRQRRCPDSAPSDPQLDPDDSGRVLTSAPQSKAGGASSFDFGGNTAGPFCWKPGATRTTPPATHDRRASTKKLSG